MKHFPLTERALHVVAGVVLGLLAAWYLWSPDQPPPDTPAPAQEIAPTKAAPHGALVLERAPNKNVKPAPLPPKHKAERVAKATVQSDKRPDCPPLTIDMTLARAPDGSQRVIASSPDGAVIGGMDVPVGPPAGVVRNLPWAAGASYAPEHRGYGGWIDRDMGPFRLGVELNQDREDRLEFRAKLGVRF